MKITFWGPRGSIPVPNKKMMEFGGNTTCVEVSIGKNTLIIDAGTGIINLGHELIRRKIRKADLFITHSHWDHIHGFPFFLPIYNTKTTVNVFGFPGSYKGLKSILAGQMSHEYFPARFLDLKAKINFVETTSTHISGTGYDVHFIRTNHPAFTMGIKIIQDGKIFVFLTDNELGSLVPITPWEKFVEFAYGADYLVHDAQFLDSEYAKHKGWGHSTFEQATKLAKEARVKNLGFFHHDPNRTDKELHQIELRMKNWCRSKKCGLKIFAVREKTHISL